jgi:UDP-2-acetamido-3-amino-2,3-dideoxy-glucuronate N-acetyltransferase
MHRPIVKRKTALVGFGDWGRNIARNLSRLQALDCVCDNDTTRLSQAAAQYPETICLHSFAELLQDPQIGQVILATPAASHYQQVKAALLAGKDVFVEKPLALTLRQGEELVQLSMMQQAILLIGHVLEYHPAIRLMHTLIEREELGPLWYAYSNRVNLGKVRQEENILWSFAPHDISVLCRLFNEPPVSVNAQGSQYLQPNIADVTMTNLNFSGERRAHIFVSWLHPYKEQRLVLIGERKMLVFDGASRMDSDKQGTLTLYDKGIEWRDGLPIARNNHEERLWFDETEPLYLECEHFLSCVATRQTPLTCGESALRVLQVLDAAQRSMEQNGSLIFL